MIVAIGSTGTLGQHLATNRVGFFQSFAGTPTVAPTAAPTNALSPTVTPLTDFCTQVALNTPVELCWKVRERNEK